MLPSAEATAAFAAFDRQVGDLRKDPFEVKALHYLRPDFWAKSHLDKCTVEEASYELEKV